MKAPTLLPLLNALATLGHSQVLPWHFVLSPLLLSGDSVAAFSIRGLFGFETTPDNDMSAEVLTDEELAVDPNHTDQVPAQGADIIYDPTLMNGIFIPDSNNHRLRSTSGHLVSRSSVWIVLLNVINTTLKGY